MTIAIDLGTTTAGSPATLDLEELLATRLLVQGNSGSGKSHLLRRLMEQSAAWVQQAVIDHCELMRYRFAVNHNANQMTVRAGIDNVTNENYWASVDDSGTYITQGEPRTFKVSLGYEF